MRNKILSSHAGPLVAVILNLLMAYCIYFIARVAYLLENYSFFKQGLDWQGMVAAFQGGVVFDSSAIMYTLALYILLMLLPLHCKENGTYH